MENTLIEKELEAITLSDLSVDIREHLHVLKQYASECKSVTELGVRWVVSTWAFIAGKPKSLSSFDINNFEIYGVSHQRIKEAADEVEVNFRFFQENVLTTNKIVETDLLFIDTLHSYKQLKMELYLHANKATKYLIFHDVISFGEHDEGEVKLDEAWSDELKAYYSKLENNTGINAAIVEFLTENRNWIVDKLYTNNNGLLILKRVRNA